MAPSEHSLHSASPRVTRSHSISSDKPSSTGYGGLLSPPLSITPEPAFIAASAASQIVTNDHDSQADSWFDQHGIEPSGETALVAPPALRLVNKFLDQLLFNFLSVSKSTSLASLRPAVGEVLKPKLAKEAVNGADQELHEYLGGGEDEELLAFHNGLEPSGDWDLELVWKRTRLRCMVYSSLGDMEEEDEDFYTEQEQLDGPPGLNNRFSNNPGVVSPAVAIFLTSILEFMGEQVLVVAGQAAYHRLRSKLEKEEREGTSTQEEIADRVVVEEADMERVALDRTLGRLWRGWKKRIRSPTTSVSFPRSFSRESNISHARASRNGSISPEDEAGRPSIEAVTTILAHEYAAGIPLPITDDDVREIEIPGLAKEIDDEEVDTETKEEVPQEMKRPKSLMIFTSHTGDLVLTPASSQPHTPIFVSSRKRSHSLPSPALSLYTSPSPKRSKIGEDKTSEDQEMTGVAATNELQGEQPAAKAEDVASNEAPTEHVEMMAENVIGEIPGEQVASKVEDVAVDDVPEHVEAMAAESPSEGGHQDTAEPHESKGLVAGVIAGAAAIGAAAVAGIAMAATGQASQTELGQKEETDVEDEEPQIMTSSRVSIGGRASPDGSSKVPSRQGSLRANSVHSLRLIDVASPTRSRHESVDGSDYVGGPPLINSRPSSIHSPLETPRVASPVSRSVNASPLARPGSQLSARHVRNSTEASILEEDVEDSDRSPLTAVPADIAAAMQGVDTTDAPGTEQFVPQSTSREVTPQPAAFTLSAPPGARNSRDSGKGLVNDQPTQHQTSNLGVSSRVLGLDNGVPPLTPLREMMEGAPDTSDEASSIAPSNDAQSVSEYGINGHSPSVSASSLANNLRDPPRTVRPHAASIPRSSPPTSSQEHSSKKMKRATHTSGSPSGSSSGSHKLKPVRTSEEDAPKSPSNDKGQSFEQLIRSDQTIQYTLTPQNMRNIEGAPESPRFTASPVTFNPQEGSRPATSRSNSSSVSKYTGLNSHPASETPKSTRLSKVSKPSPPSAVETPKSSKPVKVPSSAPTPIANTGARVRANAPQPRDARVERESMGDLAEFISSTAPPGSYEQFPSRSALNANNRGTNGTSRNISASNSRVGTAASAPRRAESSAGRSKLQARDAAVPRGDSISDLIDFVRSGPQLERENHRIPRTVAPFRTTMDSDQMSGAVGGRAVDASLPDPRYSGASASLNSSINSQSALLANPSKLNKPLPGQKPNNLDEEDMIPKRKTRKVRDMYQIDFSDEEDEYDTLASSKPKPVKEESLAEFLANVPPPPDSSPAPIFDPASLKGSKIKKKSSSPSLMSRFGRRDSLPQVAAKPMSSGSSRPPQLPSHTPISAQFTGNRPPTYEPARVNGSNYVSQLDNARNKVSQKTYQPREAIYSASSTNDLANFLRSDPPSIMSAQPQTFIPNLQREEASAFQRMFGRKKVH